MTEKRHERGRLGEEAAAAFLAARGLNILARNVRCPLGELDIVALDGKTTVFVEVKSRCSVRFGDPREAVTAGKRKRLTRLAQWYLKGHRMENLSARFDVVAILWKGESPEIKWIPNAFDACE